MREKEQGEEKEEEEEEEEAEKSSEGTYALSKCATLCALYATASTLCYRTPSLVLFLYLSYSYLHCSFSFSLSLSQSLIFPPLSFVH